MHKNIVLLSDGTGNSAAKPFKTNVWRMYQAIDIVPPAALDRPEQIVFYDNGVGTENFKPLALLGSAIGIGVWTNVKDLYTYVCRNYRPGDQIYAFGFSRGAFTVRLLMGLIGKCGVVQPPDGTESGLLHVVQMAYEAFRRDFLLRASRQRAMIYHWFLREPRYRRDATDGSVSIDIPGANQAWPDIAFVGVWDTVDAYGMPVDELKTAIDQWVWPLSFADRDLSPRILAARQALSLDDERPTFRPVLWNEIGKDGKPLGSKRVQQIWFAGVHANVGGGYPDDGLAYVALEWMMEEARQAGLRYVQGAQEEAANRADAHGEQYDSRSGVAGYYRYGPRKVRELCNDSDHNVIVPVVRVHHKAVGRIARHRVSYAPVSLNCEFRVAGGSDDGNIYASDGDTLQAAWDVVWWRRTAYFATVAVTCLLALFFVRPLFPRIGAVLEFSENILRPVWRIVRWPFCYALTLLPAEASAGLASALATVTAVSGNLLPGWAGFALKAFSVAPLTAVVLLAILVWLFFLKSEDLQDRIGARAEWAWAMLKGLNPANAPSNGRLNLVARAGRSTAMAPVYHFVTRRLFPGLIAIPVMIGWLIILILTSPYWLWRALKPRKWMA